MIGPKVEMTLERRTETLTTTQAVDHVWRPLRLIRGMLGEVGRSAGIRFDAMGIRATHQFAFDTPAGITVTEKDRFRLAQRFFDITRIEDFATRGRHTIAYLDERVGIAEEA